MGRAADRHGFDLETSIHHVKGFVRDRCADVRGFLKFDKRISPENNALVTSSTPSSEPLTATGRHAPGVSKGQHAHDVPLHSFTGTSAQPYVTREELGRSTWLFLHTLAAQYPDRPSKQQRKDVNTLVRVTISPVPPPAAIHIYLNSCASICTITKHGLLGPRLMYSRASIPAENVQNTSRPLSGMPYLPWLRLPDHDVCKPCSFIMGATHESHNYLHLSFQTGIMHPTHRAGPSCDSGCAKLTML